MVVNNSRDIVVVPNDAVVLRDGDHEPIALDLSSDRPDYVTTEGVLVWIERKKTRTRFIDAEGKQVGPWQKNLVVAIVWAAYHGWKDPTMPDWWNEQVIAEVRSGGSKSSGAGS